LPSRYAFPKVERLRRRRDFNEVFQKGTRFRGRGFVCYRLWREGQGRKFGCSVSRKSGNAVQRNRIKRYVREVYRTHRPWMRDNVHFVVVARPDAQNMTFAECRQALVELFRIGGALNG